MTKRERECFTDTLSETYAAIRYNELALSIAKDRDHRKYFMDVLSEIHLRLSLLRGVINQLGYTTLIQAAKSEGYAKGEEYFTKLNNEEEMN